MTVEVVCTDADGRRRVGNEFAYKFKGRAEESSSYSEEAARNQSSR